MKYAGHNALGILKNSTSYVIVCRLVAPRQRMIRAKLRFRTSGRRHSRYNRYNLTRLTAKTDGQPSRLETTYLTSTGSARPWRLRQRAVRRLLSEAYPYRRLQ